MRERVEALWAEEGDAAGSEFLLEPGTRRLANLVDKGDVFARMKSSVAGTFSANVNRINVPEPGTLALIGSSARRAA